MKFNNEIEGTRRNMKNKNFISSQGAFLVLVAAATCAPLIMRPPGLVQAEPRVNSFPSLFDDNEGLPPSPTESLQNSPSKKSFSTQEVPSLAKKQGYQLDIGASQSANAGSKSQLSPTTRIPVSPAQVIKSNIGSSKIQNQNQHPYPMKPAAVLSSSSGGQPTTKNYVMRNLATGEIATKRSLGLDYQSSYAASDDASQQDQKSVDYYPNFDIQRITTYSPSPISQKTSNSNKHWSSLENYLAATRKANTLNVSPLRPSDARFTSDDLRSYPAWQLYDESVDPRQFPSYHLSGNPNYLPNDKSPAITIQRPQVTSSVPSKVVVQPAIYQQQEQVDRPKYNLDQYRPPTQLDQPLYRPQTPNAQSSTTNRQVLLDYLANLRVSEPRVGSTSMDRQQQVIIPYLMNSPNLLNQLLTRHALGTNSFCGPRNFINQKTMEYKILKLQQQQNLQNSHESKTPQTVEIDLGPSEYPSHMGLYSGREPNETNYVCGATWVHESFAITLASCLQNAQLTNWTIQAGEWNLNLNNNSFRPLVRRSIKSVHLHPNYRPQVAWKDNMALVEFNEPIGLNQHSYIYPACQQHSRSQLRADSCWAPVRNVTQSSYFNPHGEGETVDKKIISMVEIPIKLISINDSECQRETKAEGFNFANPNLICSNEYRQLKKKLEANELEILGSGIYCEEGGYLSLVSMIHPWGQELQPAKLGISSSPGFLDLSYYRNWINNVINTYRDDQTSMILPGLIK